MLKKQQNSHLERRGTPRNDADSAHFANYYYFCSLFFEENTLCVYLIIAQRNTTLKHSYIMKKEISLLALALMGCSMQSFAQVSCDNEDEVYKVERFAQRDFRQGEVIVKFKADGAVRRMAPGKFKTTAVSAVDRLFAELGIEEVEPLMPLTGALPANAPRHIKSYSGQTIELQDLSKLYTVRFKMDEQTNVFSVIEKLQTLDEVEFVEPNYLVYLADATEVHEANEVEATTEDAEHVDTSTLWPNEPLVSQLWGLDAINLPQLWMQEKITDKRPVIAILDTGVDITHPDLADNIWTNIHESEDSENADDDANGFKDDVHGWDFVNNSPRIRDNNGHGTHCAGIAGAVGGNGVGIVGANPDALIMPVTVMQSDGTGDVATIIKGIDYAAANGADVISMSFGGYTASAAEEQALGRAYTTAILVAAAGNDGYCMNHAHLEKGQIAPMPMFPAAYNFVLGVQASGQAGQKASFSNYDDDGGFYSAYGEDKLYNYELQAPGANILSAFPGGKYKTLSGTSMACPLAAGAISRLMQSKDISNKEELFGDLIKSTTSVGNLDIFAAYNISDADRQPSLSLITYNLDDSAGDGDGRVDAGEIIDIYPVIRNAWGKAVDIKFSIALVENEDPEIVEIINEEAEFGYTLRSYGKATSANPLRIKISENCADDRHIGLVITCTCNGIPHFAQDIVMVAENMEELSGIISNNVTLYSDKCYKMVANLGVADGGVLTIEPGTLIKVNPGCGLSLAKGGHLKIQGTAEKKIIFTSNGSVWNGITTQWYGAAKPDTIKFVRFEYANHNVPRTGDMEIYEDCEFIYSSSQAPFIVSGKRNNMFYSKGNGSSTGPDRRGEYNNIINNDIFSSYYWDWIGEIPPYDEKNNIFSNYFSVNGKRYYASTALRSSSPILLTTDTPAYLGTSSEKVAHNYVFDINNPYTANVTFGQIDLSNMPTRPYSEAHGIVWKVVVNGKDAQDEFEELAPLGVGKHKFEVYFNRPMNTEVTPFISMGVREPYTQTVIAEDGCWNEAGDIYTAYLTITGKTNCDGLNRIYVADAQDDEYFEIPVEKYRFNVNVQKAGSMATGLMAEAGLGKVNLTWETDAEDFADMMGYNVYRYTINDKGEQSVEQKLNENLVESDETTYTDFDVVPGTTYYYVVKEMGTDLQEHIVSNAVAATPLTAQKGDANGSMTVDVADVVTEVNYLTNQNPQPFIFEAADVNSDNAVNILDVVGTVNLIFRPDAVGIESVDNTATYFVNDGILYVDTPTPLGGAQVSIAAPQGTEFEALEGLSGMEQASFWQNDNAYMLLAYSMSGKYIPMGVQPLLRVGDAEVTDMVLSDTRGHNVLAINDAVTSINALPFGFENYDGAEVRYYDLSGRAISRRQAELQGVHIQSIFMNGQHVKSYKVLK